MRAETWHVGCSGPLECLAVVVSYLAMDRALNGKPRSSRAPLPKFGPEFVYDPRLLGTRRWDRTFEAPGRRMVSAIDLLGLARPWNRRVYSHPHERRLDVQSGWVAAALPGQHKLLLQSS
eukprot:scaffold38562_cov27-Tisochrysis_lutea.AAC.4